MQKTNIKMLFDLLCDTFENTVIIIFENDNQILFANAENDAYLKGLNCGIVKKIFRDEYRNKYTIVIPIINSVFVSIYTEYSEYEKAKIVFDMAQDIIDLFIDQHLLQDKVVQLQGSMTFFSNSLFNAKTAADKAYVTLWGAKMGFDLTIPRIVSVIDITPLDPERTLDEGIYQAVFHSLKAHPSCSEQDIVSLLDDNQIVLCKSLKNKTYHDIQTEFDFISESLKNNHNMSVIIGVGSTAREVESYSKSLEEAKSVLKFARIFKSTKPVLYISDYQLAYELLKFAREDLQHFLDKYIKVLDDDPTLADTIKALVENNMDLVSTAKALYIHRNTVVYRVNNLKKHLKLDPIHNDSDRFILNLIYIYYWTSKFKEV